VDSRSQRAFPQYVRRVLTWANTGKRFCASPACLKTESSNGENHCHGQTDGELHQNYPLPWILPGETATATPPERRWKVVTTQLPSLGIMVGETCFSPTAPWFLGGGWKESR